MPLKQYTQESSTLINWPDESTSGVIADKDIICHGSAPNGLSILLYQFHQLLNRICDSATYLVSLYDSEKNNFTHHSFPDTEHQFRPVSEMIGESDKKKMRKEQVFIEKVFNLCCMLFLSREEIEALYSDEQNAPACYPKLLIGMPLNDVIKEVLSLVRSCFPVSIQIKEELDPGIEIIIGNPCQIQQVLMNLLVNAYQAIPNSNGDIRIKTSNRILKEQSAENGGLLPGRYLELTIKDNGSGMDETTLKNLFTPFFSTKKEIGGCGLGLSTTLYIIQNHNGHIHATSKPGKGSTFKILFPAINERISLQI